jgi:hypothetical protein
MKLIEILKLKKEILNYLISHRDMSVAVNEGIANDLFLSDKQYRICGARMRKFSHKAVKELFLKNKGV